LILMRVDYQESARHGWGVTELNPYGPAAEEMRGLWQSIKRRLARAKTRQPPRKAA
jgi:chromosome partitioning protein